MLRALQIGFFFEFFYRVLPIKAYFRDSGSLPEKICSYFHKNERVSEVTKYVFKTLLEWKDRPLPLDITAFRNLHSSG